MNILLVDDHAAIRLEIVSLIVSNHTSMGIVKAMLDAGANGFVRKDHAYEELIPAIRAVAEGKPYISISATRNS